RVEALWRLAAALAQSERTAELIEGTEALAALIRAGRAGTERFDSAVRAGPELGHFAVARAAAGGDASQVEAARGGLARVLFAVLQREETGAMMTSAARNGARRERAGLLLSEAARGRDLDPAAHAAVLEEVIWVLE